MDFYEVVTQVLALLQRQKRVSYRALKRQFGIDDTYVEDLKEEFLYVHAATVEADDRGLVWVGEQAATAASPPVPETSVLTSAPATDHEREPLSYTPKHLAEKILTSRSALAGERKQVTVLFCDLANSTPMAERIGPEAMHTLLNRFFEVALNEVHRYEGTINQFLGDGFMALFGAPLAHEDHARRGVLAALALQRTLHEANVGKPYMERLYPEGLAEHSAALAHHFTLGAVWEKAFDSLTKSGDKARQAYANQEAIAFYTQALEVSQRVTPAIEAAQLLLVYEGRGRVWLLLTKCDEAIADFQQMRQLARTSGNQHQEGASLCHLATAHYQKQAEDQLPLIEHYAQEAQQLAQRLGDAKILAQSLSILGSIEVWRGNMEAAEQQLVTSLQISRREGFKDALAPNLRALSWHAYWRGHFPPAIHFAQEGVSVARAVHDGFHELYCLAYLSLAQWSLGNYQRAFSLTHEVVTKAHERQNMFFLSRMKNHLGWFYRELGAVSRAAECDHESTDLGHTHGIANVEISALINLGLDYLALGQHLRALSHLKSTLDRVAREGFGTHRRRWQIRLLIGLAELVYITGDYDQALRYVEEGLQEAQRTSSQKYVALGWALHGKIVNNLGDTDTAGAELQRAFMLADQLQSPSLFYPIAYDLGQWYESTGKERDAAALYGKTKATIEQMATAVEDDALRSTFLQSALVQEIHERAARLGG